MDTNLNVIIIDDEESSRVGLEKILTLWKCNVFLFSSAEEYLKDIEKFPNDLILLDYKMKGMDGLTALEIILSKIPSSNIIMLTAYGSEKLAVEAIKKGAYYYLKKPIEVEELKGLINQIKEKIYLKEKDKILNEIKMGERNIPPFLTSSKKMLEILKFVDFLSEKDVPVLITGETGVGKELIAKRIHFLSKRYKSPFVPVNCSAIPEELFESEIFGSEKGAFTDAVSRKGKIELAEKGTIFFDEIGDLPLTTQAKILRFLDFKEFSRLGGREQIADVRVISATNKNIEKLVKDGKFREDLYFRLNVARIHIPPLRERREDISLLIDYFLKKYKEEFDIKEFELDDKKYQEFLKNEWKGNVRELQNKIKQLILNIPDFMKENISIEENSLTLDEAILKHTLNVLKICEGNKSKTAEILKISRPTLDKILSKCKKNL